MRTPLLALLVLGVPIASNLLFGGQCAGYKCARLDVELALELLEVLTDAVRVEVAAIQVGEREAQRRPNRLRHLLHVIAAAAAADRRRVDDAHVRLALLHEGGQKVFHRFPNFYRNYSY